MTYRQFASLITKSLFELEQKNISYISSDVLRLSATYDNPGLCDTLYFRMQQEEESKKYKSLQKLFSVCDIADKEEEKEYIKRIIYENVIQLFEKIKKKDYENIEISIPGMAFNLPCYHNNVKINFEDVIISDKTSDESMVDKFCNTLYDYIKNKLEEAGHYKSYIQLQAKLGPVIFEEIRYDLNPLNCDYIIELYDLLLNNSGNLINKKFFIMVCKIKEKHYLKLIINIIKLLNFYGLYENFKDELYKIVENKDYKDLYHLYKHILYKNKNFKYIDKYLEDFLKNGIFYEEKTDLMDELINDLNFHYGKVTEEESNLYLVLNNDNRFSYEDDELSYGNETLKKDKN